MRKIVLPFVLTFVAVLASCTSELKEGRGMARLSFSITSEGEFTDPDAVRSSVPETADVNEFRLSITDRNSHKKVLSWDRYDQVPSVVSLDPGSYDVEACSPGSKDVAWSQPIFYGSTQVAISAGSVENIALVCTISNMKVSVKATEKFLSEMADYSVTVTSRYGALIFTPEIIANGTSGYFKVSPLSVDIKGTRKTGGAINHHLEIQNVAPKDHHVFTIDASETGYAELNGGISIDYTVNNREEDVFVDGLEENPIDRPGVTPLLQSTSVAADATDVATTTEKVEFTYSVPVKLIPDPQITLNGAPVQAAAEGNRISVALGTLSAGTAYTLSIPAGSVQNRNDNAPAEAATLRFQTAGGAEPVPVPITIDAPGTDTPFDATTFNPEEQPFLIKVTAEKKIAQFKVNVLSSALQELLVGVQQKNEVDLANMDPGQTEFWGGLFGITSADVKDQTSLQLSIGGFVPLMPEGNLHELRLTVVDAEGNELTKTITIRK